MSWSQAQVVFCAGGDGRLSEWQHERGAAVPKWPLVGVPGAERVSGLAVDDVFRGAVEAAPIDGEPLRGTERCAHLIDSAGDVAISSLRSRFQSTS